MNDTNEAVQPSAEENGILEQLRAADLRLAGLRDQIADLQDQARTELLTVGKLYQLFQNSNEKISLTASTIIDENPIPKKQDKRSDYNPIKNLNIGVRRPYEWKIRDGYDAETARELVYKSIFETAKSSGVKADDGSAITEISHLPAKVKAKIEEGFRDYGVIRAKKLTKKQIAAAAASNGIGQSLGQCQIEELERSNTQSV